VLLARSGVTSSASSRLVQVGFCGGGAFGLLGMFEWGRCTSVDNISLRLED
jgi:hypothetical protein